MTEKSLNLVRINTRIGHDQNNWLDERSAKTGHSKSGLVQLAIELYIQQKESTDVLKTLIDKIEVLEETAGQAQE